MILNQCADCQKFYSSSVARLGLLCPDCVVLNRTMDEPNAEILARIQRAEGCFEQLQRVPSRAKLQAQLATVQLEAATLRSLLTEIVDQVQKKDANASSEAEFIKYADALTAAKNYLATTTAKLLGYIPDPD